MRVTFYVEDQFFFRFIGCATSARALYRALENEGDLELSWKRGTTESDLVHFHTFGPLALGHLQRTEGIAVLTAHSTPRINQGNIAFASWINRLYPAVYRKFDHVITVSPPCHREISEMVPDVPATLIPNGVNRELFRPDPEKRALFREEYGIPEEERVVLSVAQLTPRKGVYDFLHVAKAHPDHRFIWVGGLPYGALSKDYYRIRNLREQAGPNVIFTGYVDDITAPYAAADVFFMGSYAETFGLVILEALSSGLPVIARDIPEFREIFGPSILYFSAIDEVSELLGDDGVVERCRAAARESTLPFDIRSIAARHASLYRSLAA
ncbi:MAG TPA: glycosyltransferase family 4 protein [Methanoregulaceae archaeon]|nr:glycosyltransferase family 4 protein [Methanoregulaceae archaeon]HOV68259.1 glycosyltransferase family 4 protein [Methanoregulaceae archaeon]HQJ87913.1 glycosyltransferase family 4 protein [Methanoregulaceae archaeon]